jgi:hypothetical protein
MLWLQTADGEDIERTVMKTKILLVGRRGCGNRDGIYSDEGDRGAAGTRVTRVLVRGEGGPRARQGGTPAEQTSLDLMLHY